MREKFTPETFYRAVEGDKRSVNATVEAFTPMVHKWVNRYKYMCPTYFVEDLVQEGIIGILAAIRTFDMSRRSNEKLINPSTWVWHKTRTAVQSAARKYQRLGKDQTPLIDDQTFSQPESGHYGPSSTDFSIDLDKILAEICGADSRKADIIKDRFGLNDRRPLKFREIAEKHGISKQATSTQIIRFSRVCRERYPELRDLIS